MRVFLSLLLFFLGAPVMAVEITAPMSSLNNAFFENPDPASKEWETLPAITVQLFPQNITTPSIHQTSVAALNVRSVHNGKWLAILLEWEDRSEDVHVSNDHFSDACAIQFPSKKSNNTSPFMGTKDLPVAITHWKAIWQKDVDQSYQQVTDLYPNTWVDTYRFGKSVAFDAKNPIAYEGRKKSVEELMAGGFGSLTYQSQQDSEGRGIWRDGYWRVVFTRHLKSTDSKDPSFEPGEKTVMAFAVWDGGNQNVGARKNYAPWVPLILEKK